MQAESTGHHAPQNAAGATILPARKILGATFGFLKSDWKPILLTVLIPTFCISIVSALTTIKDQLSYLEQSISGGFLLFLINATIFLAYLVFYLFYIIIPVIIFKYLIDSKESKPELWNTYKKSFGLIIPFIWVGILLNLLSWGTIVFLIIPYFALSIYIIFAIPILVEGKYRGLSAISYSAYLVYKNWWRILFRTITIFLILYALFSVIFIPVLLLYINGGSKIIGEEVLGSFITFLVILLSVIFTSSFYFLYQSVSSLKLPPTEEILKKIKRFFMGLAIWGIVAIVVIIVAVVTLSSLTERTYKDPANSFEITYPGTWKVSEESNAVYFISPYGSKQDLRGEVSVVKAPISKDFTLKQIEEGILKEDPNALKEEIVLLGMPAHSYLWTMKVPISEDGKIYATEKIKQIIVTKDDYIFIISYENSEKGFEKVRPEAEKIIQSFKIK